MLKDALLLVAGLALLVKGGDLFVAAALRIAGFLRMPRVVVGSTIVSLATTMPEMVVSVIAGARGNSSLAVSNALGSCVCNTGLSFGITATLKTVSIHPHALRTALRMTLDLALQRWQGGLLLMAGAGYFAYDLIHAARQRKPEEIAEARSIEQADIKGLAWFQTRAGTVAQFILAAGVVSIQVDNAEETKRVIETFVASGTGIETVARREEVA